MLSLDNYSATISGTKGSCLASAVTRFLLNYLQSNEKYYFYTGTLRIFDKVIAPCPEGVMKNSAVRHLGVLYMRWFWRSTTNWYVVRKLVPRLLVIKDGSQFLGKSLMYITVKLIIRQNLFTTSIHNVHWNINGMGRSAALYCSARLNHCFNSN